MKERKLGNETPDKKRKRAVLARSVTEGEKTNSCSLAQWWRGKNSEEKADFSLSEKSALQKESGLRTWNTDTKD